MEHPPIPQTPGAARRQLGSDLRSSRELAGLTLSEASARIQRSSATLSRLETGKSLPRLVDVEALIDFYAEKSGSAVLNGNRNRFLELAEAGRDKEWFDGFRDVISSSMTADDHQRYVEFETDATAIQSFQPELVPGLLQTRAYAEAVTLLFFPSRTAAERKRFVDFRLARQHVLTRSGNAVNLDVVVGEAALHRVVGSTATMREQGQSLLDNARNGLANVRVRIAPIGLSIPAVVGGSFLLMEFGTDAEPGLVYLEGRTGSQYLQSPDVFDRYRTLFSELSGAVLDESDSQKKLEEVLHKLH